MIQSFIEATSVLLQNGKFTSLIDRQVCMHFKYVKYNHVKHLCSFPIEFNEPIKIIFQFNSSSYSIISLALADSWQFIEGIRSRFFLCVKLQCLPGCVQSQENGAVLNVSIS